MKGRQTQTAAAFEHMLSGGEFTESAAKESAWSQIFLGQEDNATNVTKHCKPRITREVSLGASYNRFNATEDTNIPERISPDRSNVNICGSIAMRAMKQYFIKVSHLSRNGSTDTNELKEDGFYVGPSPAVSWSRQGKKTLLEGTSAGMSDNLSETPANNKSGRGGENIGFRYLQPCNNKYSAEKKNTHLHHFDGIFLCVFVSQIVFNCHTEFLEEERLGSEIILVYDRYKSFLESERVPYLRRRLHTLIRKAMFIKAQSESKQGHENKLDYDDIMKVANETFLEIEKYLSLFIKAKGEIDCLEANLMKKWKLLVRARDKQGFCCTTIELDMEDIKICKDPTDSLFTISSDLKEAQNRPLAADIKFLMSWLSKMSTKIETPYACEPESPSNILMQKQDAMILSTMNSLDSFGVTSRVVLSFKPDIKQNDAHVQSKAERIRRAQINDERYFIRLYIDGKVVGSSKATALRWPSFCLDFNKTFRCKVRNRTRPIVCVKIFKQNLWGLIPHQLISSIFALSPGEESCFKASSIDLMGPNVCWYQFGCESHRSKCFGQPCMRGSALIAVQWENESGNSQVRGSTFISYRHQNYQSFQVPVNHTMGKEPRLQGIRPEAMITKQVCVENKNSSGSILKMEQSPGTLFSLIGSQNPFTNYHIFQEPKRHALLKLREFNGLHVPSPIPLDEKVIKGDIEYTHLIRDQQPDPEVSSGC